MQVALQKLLRNAAESEQGENSSSIQLAMRTIKEMPCDRGNIRVSYSCLLLAKKNILIEWFDVTDGIKESLDTGQLFSLISRLFACLDLSSISQTSWGLHQVKNAEIIKHFKFHARKSTKKGIYDILFQSSNFQSHM